MQLHQGSVAKRIEISGKGNLKCVMCGQSKGYYGKILKLEEIKKLTSVFKYATEVTLHGYGEPLVSPYFFKVFELVPENVLVSFLTNGHLVNSQFILKLKKHYNRIGSISFSIDTCDPKTYSYIRGQEFNKVKNNLILFRDAFRTKINYVLNSTVMKCNMNGMRDFVLFGIEMGAKEICFWPLVPNPKHLDLGDWVIKKNGVTFSYISEMFDSRDIENYIYTIKTLQNEFSDQIKINSVSWKSPQVSLKEPKECNVAISNRVYYAHGGAKHCCYQTKFIFNWIEKENVEFESYSSHKRIIDTLKNNLIPPECSKAACEYVGGKESEEIVEGFHHPVDLRITKRF
jgi:MoaA/NifB/PqqE/SkfB family radical SAM enzyme